MRIHRKPGMAADMGKRKTGAAAYIAAAVVMQMPPYLLTNFGKETPQKETLNA